MGKARFYARFYFYNEREARRSVGRLRKFLEEGQRAFAFWALHRYEKDPSIFWNQFKRRFPWITRYLREMEIFGTSEIDRGLGNYLRFGFNGSPRPIYQMSIEEEPNLFQERNIIYYECWSWQSSNFDPWGDFLKGEFKISFFEWCNDESDLSQKSLKRKHLHLVKQSKEGQINS